MFDTTCDGYIDVTDDLSDMVEMKFVGDNLSVLVKLLVIFVTRIQKILSATPKNCHQHPLIIYWFPNR